MAKNEDLVSTFFNEWADVIKNLKFDENKRTNRVVYENEKIINAIWAWWHTKPQKRKNDATIRIITREDIVELVNTIKNWEAVNDTRTIR